VSASLSFTSASLSTPLVPAKARAISPPADPANYPPLLHGIRIGKSPGGIYGSRLDGRNGLLRVVDGVFHALFNVACGARDVLLNLPRVGGEQVFAGLVKPFGRALCCVEQTYCHARLEFDLVDYGFANGVFAYRRHRPVYVRHGVFDHGPLGCFGCLDQGQFRGAHEFLGLGYGPGDRLLDGIRGRLDTVSYGPGLLFDGFGVHQVLYCFRRLLDLLLYLGYFRLDVGGDPAAALHDFLDGRFGRDGPGDVLYGGCGPAYLVRYALGDAL